MARLTALRQLDSSFGGNGAVLTNLAMYTDGQGVSRPTRDAANDVAVQPDGKTLAEGVSSSNQGGDFALVRYNPDGSLDRCFDGDGKVLTDAGANDSAKAIALQADGKIVAAGSDTSEFIPAEGRFSAGTSCCFAIGSTGRLIMASARGAR